MIPGPVLLMAAHRSVRDGKIPPINCQRSIRIRHRATERVVDGLLHRLLSEGRQGGEPVRQAVDLRAGRREARALVAHDHVTHAGEHAAGRNALHSRSGR
jgi:hypothetical protein